MPAIVVASAPAPTTNPTPGIAIAPMATIHPPSPPRNMPSAAPATAPPPTGLMARTPVEPRAHSRLLVLGRASGKIEHRRFYDLGEYLRVGDLLVANESRVLPARLIGHKVPTGGRVEVLLLRAFPSNLRG